MTFTPEKRNFCGVNWRTESAKRGAFCKNKKHPWVPEKASVPRMGVSVCQWQTSYELTEPVGETPGNRNQLSLVGE